MSTEFDPNWPHGHVTRDGRKARIVCLDMKGRWPIVALTEDDDGEEWPDAYRADGRLKTGGKEDRADLINAPAPKAAELESWVNVYSKDIGLSYGSKDDADFNQRGGRINCRHIVYRNNRIVDITDGEDDGKAELVEALRKISSFSAVKFEGGSVTYINDTRFFNDLLRCAQTAQDALAKHEGRKP